MDLLRRLPLFLFCMNVVAVCVNGQNCPPISQQLLGSVSALSTNGLIPTAFTASGNNQALPEVQIFNYTVVCEVSGDSISTTRGVSILLVYDCDSTRDDLPECTPGIDRVTRQFHFACSNTGNEWTTTIAGTSNFVVSATTQATLDTQLDNTCGLCVDPQQVGSADPVTHCVDCHSNCNRGLMRCHGTGPNDCCNFYQQELCVADCGSGLVPNSDHFCGCPAPSNPTNGQVSSTEITMIGDIVTYTCNDISDIRTRTCTPIGWDGPEPTCEIVRCLASDVMDPVGGLVTFSDVPAVIGSTASYVCDADRVLQGNEQRTCQATGTWSGTDAVCDLCSDKIPNCDVCEVQNGVVVCTKCAAEYLLSADNAMCNDAKPGGSSGACGTGCIISIIVAILAAVVLSTIVP